MARVLRIERDEGRRQTVVSLESGEELTVALEAEEARGLAPGSVLEEDREQDLRRAAQRKAVAREVFRHLDRRRRTRSWLHDRLVEKGHPADPVDAVLDDFQDQGLIDDRDYARAWSEDTLRRKAVGRMWLHARLRAAGVTEDDAWAGIDEALPPDEEPDQALRALRRRRLDLSETRQRAKALRFLTGRGFAREIALEALDRARSGPEAGGEDSLEGEH